jgi:GT2 family glycosyltransferase
MMDKSDMTLSLAMPLGHWSPQLKIALSSISNANTQSQYGQIALSIMDASQDERVQEDIKASAITPAYIRTGPDGGQTAAISEGWTQVDGNIVGWLNGDDALIPGALDIVFKYFQENPDTDVVCAQSVISNKHGHIIGLHPEVVPISALLLRSNIISQPSCFVRRTAMEAVSGLNDDLVYTMDWDFWLRLYQSDKKFVYIDQVLSNVIWASETKTSKFNWTRIKELYKIVRQNNDLYVSAKSLFGFFQHYSRIYMKPVQQSKTTSSLKTPIAPKLKLPILNLTPITQTHLNIKIDGVNSEPHANLIVDGSPKGSMVRHKLLELTSPIKPGDCIFLEFENISGKAVFFEETVWGSDDYSN